MEENKSFKLKDLLKMDLKDIKLNFPNKTKSKKKIVNKKLPKKVISLDIGSNTIKFAVGKYDKDKVIIDKLIKVKTPEKSVDNGIITNKEAVLDIVDYIIKNEGIKAKHVIYTTDSTTIMTREVVIPMVEEDEMETVIRYEIQQVLPIEINNYILQYTILDTIENEMEGTKKYKVSTILYQDRIAREYYNLLNDSNIKPYALDITSNSLKKLIGIADYINGTKVSDEETIAFIDLGAQSININIYKNRELDFTRLIRSGGNDINNQLINILDLPRNTVENTKIEKINLKDIKEDDEFNNLIEETIGVWLDDIGRFLQFYRNRNVGNTIDKVYIYGGSSNITGIEHYMSNKLNLQVQKIKSINKVDVLSPLSKEEGLETYINAIGAIIRL